MSRNVGEIMNRELLAQEDTHHLVVVDGSGVAVGLVSVLDVLRAMYGIPAHHPAAFPHWNASTQSSWTDEWPLDDAHASHAPDAGVRALTAPGSSAEPSLARLLERRDLRFRAAAVRNDVERDRITSGLRSDLEHRPPPGAT